MSVAPGISQKDLESYLWGAATLLRGSIDAGDYKGLIFPLLFLKRISDVWDEEHAQSVAEFGEEFDDREFSESHRFQIPEGHHWSDLRNVAVDVGSSVQAAMRGIEVANGDRLFGIFGDARWTNKERLPDSLLRDLIEHFSTVDLSLENVPEDEFGQAYEYLVRRFADDSGHTAQEFYTNRTLVRLMTLVLAPEPGETVYDPTCGTGGMLLSAAVELRNQGKEHRNLGLFGQEINLMTSSIARMNLFLHGITDFNIERGDTLSEPRFVEGDALRKFDVVLANPPYSISKWNRAAFSADPFGRNTLGSPPQGRADFAFLQHILASMDDNSGRSATLFPNGVLFREEEEEMRARLIASDLIDCVLGLGPGLFYNSPMEACVLFCRSKKPVEHKGKILLINAVDEYERRDAQSFLSEGNIERIANAYAAFEDIDDFARVVSVEEVSARDNSLSLPLYVGKQGSESDVRNLPRAFEAWKENASYSKDSMARVLKALETEL
jgi:type I restriction enzyme M protein